MINVLICAHRSGDVLPLALQQFVNVPEITRILIADGPHRGDIKPGAKVMKPTVRNVVDSFETCKIYYQYTDYFKNRARKNNNILPYITKDCKWILNVDSDEIYHENDLVKLIRFLNDCPMYGRYKIKTINPYPDFHHEFRIPDWKPRLYKYKKGDHCPDSCRLHQYVIGKHQRQFMGEHYGMAFLPPEICQIYHLNALRSPLPEHQRVKKNENGTIRYKGGGERHISKVYDLDIRNAPRSIRELERDTL